MQIFTNDLFRIDFENEVLTIAILRIDVKL